MNKTLLTTAILLLVGQGCVSANVDVDNSKVEKKSKPINVEEVKKELKINKEVDQPINEQAMQRTLPKQEDLATEFTKAKLITTLGDITVEFYAEDSPITVNNFLNLAKDGFYDGTSFHRVISDFMIQGGDPNSKDQTNKASHGTGGPGYKFADEFNQNPLVKGSLAMANSGPNTNGSQFFIVTLDATPWLDGKHTNFGRVVDGVEVVDAIEGVEKDARDNPLESVLIKSIELLK
jgi:cyclophilin family peptidyl-prolyl cis-trans isomerase